MIIGVVLVNCWGICCCDCFVIDDCGLGIFEKESVVVCVDCVVVGIVDCGCEFVC